MYETNSHKKVAKLKEVTDKLKLIRQLLKTEQGRRKVSREVRRKWL